jgi:hypothetical protein
MLNSIDIGDPHRMAYCLFTDAANRFDEGRGIKSRHSPSDGCEAP